MSDPVQQHFQHPDARVESPHIGAGTRVWAFAHVLPGAVVGRDCNLCDGVFVENDVVVGNGVTVKCGVQLWDGVRLEDDVFVGPNATFTNDLFPRSRQHPAAYAQTIVERGASIGANATILAGLRIGAGAMVAAGAVVTRSVPPGAIVMGNPARITGHVDERDSAVEPPVGALTVPGARLLQLPQTRDLGGTRSLLQGEHLPFTPQRVAMLHGVPGPAMRDAGGQRTQQQLLVCVAGRCLVTVQAGGVQQTVALDSPQQALHLQPGVWSVRHGFAAGAVLLLLASGTDDAADTMAAPQPVTSAQNV